jgi:hypothetical protein
MSYVSLAEFAANRTAPPAVAPFAVHPDAAPPRLPDPVAARLDELLDTVVAVQRAAWLEDGAYVGPQTLPDAWRATLEAARRLGAPVPVVIAANVAAAAQGAQGTDDRPFLLLSAALPASATPAELRFELGRQLGQIVAGQVSARTLYALVVDHDGARRLARRAVGPALDVVLAPIALGLRAALSRWHREAELTADRAGLLACDDLEAARAALLRGALGADPTMTAEAWLRRGDSVRDAGPGRWTEILADRPWLRKRLRALDDWARSETFAALGGTPTPGARLDADELARRTAALLAVGA